mgnify:CR=1 FL=1
MWTNYHGDLYLDNVRETKANGADKTFLTDSNVDFYLRQVNQKFHFYVYIWSIASENKD